MPWVHLLFPYLYAVAYVLLPFPLPPQTPYIAYITLRTITFLIPGGLPWRMPAGLYPACIPPGPKCAYRLLPSVGMSLGGCITLPLLISAYLPGGGRLYR